MMLNFDVNSARVEMRGKLLRAIHRTMLTAGASEAYHEMLESARNVIPDCDLDHLKNGNEKVLNFRLRRKKLCVLRIDSRELCKESLSSGIRQTTAIEDEASLVSVSVLRNAVQMIAKTVNRYGE